MKRSRIRRLTLLFVLGVVCAAMAPAEDLDTFIRGEMSKREIVGLSIAIIDDGRIVLARGYGTTTRGGSKPVTPTTLFQAGSISKPVAAVGALQLVEQGKLSLDEDVNVKLNSWQIPSNQFTTTERVTLRRLLSHSAGLTVHGFPGYDTQERVPSAIEVLDGKGNTPAVRVDVVPGSIWRYSGGGYTVMQQLVVDVGGRTFPDYMRSNVLQPLGMTSSTYEQPLPAPLAAQTASGYYADRGAVRGHWHVYPEMAAAGLWTTPTDLAKYAIGVQQALAGQSKVLSAEMARQMLTVQKGTHGLGPGLAGSGATLRFSHGGRDAGFDAQLIAYADGGDGVAIMINANDNSRTMARIVNYVARTYNWPAFPQPTVETVEPANDPVLAQAAAGRYEFMNNNMITLIPIQGRLFVDVNGLPDEELIAGKDGRFVSAERPLSFRLLRAASGEVEALELTQGGSVRRIPRIGPLFPERAPSDPDPAVTSRLISVLQAFGVGGAAVTESLLLTAGARGALARPDVQLSEARALTFAVAQDVTGRGIERHGHAIARVLHYRLDTPAGVKLVLIHLDPAGLVADYDVVSR